MVLVCDKCFYEDYECVCDWNEEEYEIHMFEVDLEIQPAISLLNQKGYLTKFSCSGHSERKIIDPYVAFERPYQFDKLPEGWRYDFFIYRGKKKEYRNVIRPYKLNNKVRKIMSIMELEDYIEKVNCDLISWAENLEGCSSVNILEIEPKSKYEKEKTKFAKKYNLNYFPPYLIK